MVYRPLRSSWGTSQLFAMHEDRDLSWRRPSWEDFADAICTGWAWATETDELRVEPRQKLGVKIKIIIRRMG